MSGVKRNTSSSLVLFILALEYDSLVPFSPLRGIFKMPRLLINIPSPAGIIQQTDNRVTMLYKHKSKHRDFTVNPISTDLT